MGKIILAIAPHYDDLEHGCSATLHKWICQGAKVVTLNLSPCEESLPEGYSVKDIKDELYQAQTSLGIEKENIILENYPVRKFDSFRQEILQTIIDTKKSIFDKYGKFPDVVFCHCRQDYHQDHSVVTNETIRAFKNCSTILGYKAPWNNLEESMNCFVNVSAYDIQKKVAAIKAYRSQTIKKPDLYTDFTYRSFARSAGVCINTNFAESFEVIKVLL